MRQQSRLKQGLSIRTGTILDVNIITAASSTKNRDKLRDPKTHQTKKGNQWYFGMKGHIGVDGKSRVIPSVVATPANFYDSQVLEDLCLGMKPASGSINYIVAWSLPVNITSKDVCISPHGICQ